MAYNSDDMRAIILLHKDSSVHLCLDNYYTYHLTAEMLISFLTSPTAFLDSPIDANYDSSERINPTDLPLSKLPGVTLGTFSYSRKLTIIFPELLQHTLSLPAGPKRSERIYMRSFISNLDRSDAKSFLLRYFLDFSKEAEKGIVVQNTFNIDEESFYSIMREIFNASVSFVPPKPPEKTVEQRLNEAVQQVAVEKRQDSQLISLPKYVDQKGLYYPSVLEAVKAGKFKTVVRKGRNYYINFNEAPPKFLLQGKNPIKEKSKPKQNPTPVAGIRMSPEEMRKYARENQLYSNLVLKFIASKEELDFYVNNNYREVEWDGFHYLICDIDLSTKDESGRANEQLIMEDKKSPVTRNPHTMEFKEVHMHHLGQREEVLVPIEFHIHSEHQTLFHPTEPPYDLHTSAFETAKKAFWRRYVSEIKKYGSFDKIPYLYPKQLKK